MKYMSFWPINHACNNYANLYKIQWSGQNHSSAKMTTDPWWNRSLPNIIMAQVLATSQNVHTNRANGNMNIVNKTNYSVHSFNWIGKISLNHQKKRHGGWPLCICLFAFFVQLSRHWPLQTVGFHKLRVKNAFCIYDYFLVTIPWHLTPFTFNVPNRVMLLRSICSSSFSRLINSAVESWNTPDLQDYNLTVSVTPPFLH